MFKKYTIAAALVVAAITPRTFAQDHWKFDVVNNSDLTTDGFRTQENGAWSENWLHTVIGPGQGSTLDFLHGDGACVVRTQIRFTDNTYFDYDVDYCKVNTLHIFNTSVKWE